MDRQAWLGAYNKASTLSARSSKQALLVIGCASGAAMPSDSCGILDWRRRILLFTFRGREWPSDLFQAGVSWCLGASKTERRQYCCIVERLRDWQHCHCVGKDRTSCHPRQTLVWQRLSHLRTTRDCAYNKGIIYSNRCENITNLPLSG